MKKLIAAALLAGTMVAAPATAAVFDFSYSGTGVNAFGQITTADGVDADGFSLVTGITGTRNGVTIASLLAPDAFGGNDNLFRVTDPSFTNNGLSFSANNILYNIYTSASEVCLGELETASTGSFTCGGSTSIAFTAQLAAGAPVPEPATWAMMLLGFGMVAGAARYRRRSMTAVYA